LFAQSKQEIRAVWVTVNYALDWPDKPFQNAQDIIRQEADLDRIVDQLKEANLNTVFLQTRLRGDVIYPSRLEPRNENIKNPYATADYDPLAYAVEACHKRGLECHAWFVVYPLGPERKSNPSETVIKNNSLVKTFKKDLYLDPGNPQTTTYLIRLIKEIVSSYDIDGIHFDYIRYPDGSGKFPDEDTYIRYGRGENKDDWRRENINQFVYAAYDAVKDLKPWVQVSSSVVGMYKNLPGKSKKHWTAYQSVYQDPIDWLDKGKHDFIVPMMYFSGDLFFPFAQDWVSRSNGRFIVPGLGLFRMDYKEADWDAEVILEQIRYSREIQTAGNAFFRVQHLVDNKKNVLREITSSLYNHPAVLPPLTWLNTEIPPAPTSISAYKIRQVLHLEWDKANRDVYYNIYRSERFPVDTSNPDHLIATRLIDNQYEILLTNDIESGYYYVVTSYDRYHNESQSSAPVYFVTGNFEK
jgi:uncharacterized lipoprotein YddW (UPF0748 family)